jgi:hypothetical protein
VFTVCNKLSQCRPTENTSAHIQQHQMLAPLGAASLPSMHVHCTPMHTQHAAHSHLMPEWRSQLISQAGYAPSAFAGRAQPSSHMTFSCGLAQLVLEGLSMCAAAVSSTRLASLSPNNSQHNMLCLGCRITATPRQVQWMCGTTGDGTTTHTMPQDDTLAGAPCT